MLIGICQKQRKLFQDYMGAHVLLGNSDFFEVLARPRTEFSVHLGGTGEKRKLIISSQDFWPNFAFFLPNLGEIWLKIGEIWLTPNIYGYA